MAMLVLNEVFAGTWQQRVDLLWRVPSDEFWPAATRARRSLTYLAEVYWDREWELQQQGFHFTYDKRLLDRLHRGRSRRRSAAISMPTRPTRERLVRFLENHDEPRSAAELWRDVCRRRRRLP